MSFPRSILKQTFFCNSSLILTALLVRINQCELQKRKLDVKVERMKYEFKRKQKGLHTQQSLGCVLNTLSSFAPFQYRTHINKPEQVQQRHGQGLEHLPCKERLRDLQLFKLEKGGLKAACPVLYMQGNH